MGVQSSQSSEPPSTTAMVIFCFIAFVAGSCLSAVFCYYWLKKHQHSLPSSPHYISKQNPYVTVPLREVSTPKRTPSFSKNSLPANGTTPKLFSQKASSDYETATIKRNSHNLLNGHTRTSTLEQDKFFWNGFSRRDPYFLRVCSVVFSLRVKLVVKIYLQFFFSSFFFTLL